MAAFIEFVLALTTQSASRAQDIYQKWEEEALNSHDQEVWQIAISRLSPGLLTCLLSLPFFCERLEGKNNSYLFGPYPNRRYYNEMYLPTPARTLVRQDRALINDQSIPNKYTNWNTGTLLEEADPVLVRLEGYYKEQKMDVELHQQLPNLASKMRIPYLDRIMNDKIRDRNLIGKLVVNAPFNLNDIIQYLGELPDDDSLKMHFFKFDIENRPELYHERDDNGDVIPFTNAYVKPLLYETLFLSPNCWRSVKEGTEQGDPCTDCAGHWDFLSREWSCRFVCVENRDQCPRVGLEVFGFCNEHSKQLDFAHSQDKVANPSFDVDLSFPLFALLPPDTIICGEFAFYHAYRLKFMMSRYINPPQSITIATTFPPDYLQQELEQDEALRQLQMPRKVNTIDHIKGIQAVYEFTYIYAILQVNGQRRTTSRQLLWLQRKQGNDYFENTSSLLFDNAFRIYYQPQKFGMIDMTLFIGTEIDWIIDKTWTVVEHGLERDLITLENALKYEQKYKLQINPRFWNVQDFLYRAYNENSENFSFAYLVEILVAWNTIIKRFPDSPSSKMLLLMAPPHSIRFYLSDIKIKIVRYDVNYLWRYFPKDRQDYDTDSLPLLGPIFGFYFENRSNVSEVEIRGKTWKINDLLRKKKVWQEQELKELDLPNDCYNVITQEIEIKNYLEEAKDENEVPIVFVRIQKNNNKAFAACTTKKELMMVASQSTSRFYECLGPSEKYTVSDQTYIKLIVFGDPVFITLENFEFILQSEYTYFLIEQHPFYHLEYSIKELLYPYDEHKILLAEPDTERDELGYLLPYQSADHCQRGSEKNIFMIYPLNESKLNLGHARKRVAYHV